MLVYDADCAFCTRYALWVAERMRGSRVEPWQSGALTLERAGLTPDDCIEASWWVDEHGAPLRGEHAIAQSLLQAGGWWRLLGLVLQTPGVSYLSAVGYRFVAENRQLMPGGTAACAVDGGSTPARVDVDRASNIR